jgi:hypothetical protein
MADRLEWFDVVIPAGTPIAAPVTIPMVFADGEVTEIDVKVLDGPSGLVGFQIAAGGSQYVPRTLGTFVRPNDDYFTWPMANAINSGSWGITGYNLDIWDHNIQVGFQVNDRGLSQSATQAGVGVSSSIAIATATAVQASQVAAADPLSPDSLLASVAPEVTDFLASQQAPDETIGALTDAGTS